MDDKQALEDYRVRQFGQPLAKAVQHQEALPQDEDIQPDTARVVAHFDVDAFYCQVEELRRPGLANRPMGKDHSCALMLYLLQGGAYQAVRGASMLALLTLSDSLCLLHAHFNEKLTLMLSTSAKQPC